MKVIRANDVNDGFMKAIQLVKAEHRVISPRGQETLEITEPVTTVYKNPCNRVLFSDERDANPFFHFMEGLWMLAGRNDVEWISQFNSNIGNYSDDGEVFNAAYGYRLERHFGYSQLSIVGEMLKKDPDSRQAVCQIWDEDFDLNTPTKDVPCNDLLMFKVRDGKLNMSVANRSNDIIWGCYGANAVHFSMIQEYVAARVGVPVGEYRQVSDSLHVYVDNPIWDRVKDIRLDSMNYWYKDHIAEAYPMVSIVEDWDEDLELFMGLTDLNPKQTLGEEVFKENFFNLVVAPMYNTYVAYKLNGKKFAQEVNRTIQASDWRIACDNWLERRSK